MTQVITFHPDGSVSGLQRKPGQGIDLTKLGKATVRRASEIVWDDDAQAWKIDVLQDAGKGVVTGQRLEDAGIYIKSLFDNITKPVSYLDHEEAFLIDDYDTAVSVEIAYLDALRVKGQH